MNIMFVCICICLCFSLKINKLQKKVCIYMQMVLTGTCL